jgi:hypothetical protein
MFFRSSLENDSREGLRLAITHNELAAKTEIRQGSCSPGPASYRTMPNLIGKVLVVWRGLVEGRFDRLAPEQRGCAFEGQIGPTRSST